MRAYWRPSPEPRKEGADYIETETAKMSEWSLQGQRRWSFANNTSTILIVTFSAVTAVVSQIKSSTIGGYDPRNVATFLSLIVTIVSAVQAKLGFERKWAANRKTQSACRQLMVDIRASGTGVAELSSTLKRIIADHDAEIVAATTSSKPS